MSCSIVVISYFDVGLRVYQPDYIGLISRKSLARGMLRNGSLTHMLQAGAANFADLLADPGGEGGSAQLGGEAGASPLFKWTSDGSMMEELMKAYKSVNQPSCTYCSVVS